MDVVKGSWNAQQWLEDRVKRFGKGKYGRVLKMARKPDNEEFLKVVQVTGIGMILIGALGFVIYLAWNYLPSIIYDFLFP